MLTVKINFVSCMNAIVLEDWTGFAVRKSYFTQNQISTMWVQIFHSEVKLLLLALILNICCLILK